MIWVVVWELLVQERVCLTLQDFIKQNQRNQANQLNFAANLQERTLLDAARRNAIQLK